MQQRSKPQKRALRAVIFLLIVVLLYSAAANVLSVNTVSYTHLTLPTTERV